MTNCLDIRNLTKIFGPRSTELAKLLKAGLSKRDLNEKHGHILGVNDISLSVRAGEILVVMGLSGSGKSTFVRLLNRLIEPTEGEVLCEGVDVTKLSAGDLRKFRQKRTAMVFQKFGLFPHRTVLENAAYGLELQGVPLDKRRREASTWIERVGLSGSENHYPNQLSGGMQQRVGLARALATEADILLMDEAYSALDPLIRVDMQDMLLALQKDLKKTVIFITHDLSEALKLGHNIVVLREGTVMQQGRGKDIVLNPANDYVAKFVRDVNRASVLRVGDVLDPMALGGSRLKLAEDSTVYAALKFMNTEQVSAANVVDDTGRTIGTVSMNSIVAAIAT
ncbi:glycine betaine/L-proline ABC transporter ATP-binding protein [Rhizobium sp. 2YAF20]|uniref:quaternary amine ABC transporter ATP-binding protein n=1 Tax=Rhizobium sp. 2YAF20 TaxID=3233027 RepID=UPI003F98E05A